MSKSTHIRPPAAGSWTTREVMGSEEGIGRAIEDASGEVVCYLPACFNVDYEPLLLALVAACQEAFCVTSGEVEAQLRAALTAAGIE